MESIFIGIVLLGLSYALFKAVDASAEAFAHMQVYHGKYAMSYHFAGTVLTMLTVLSLFAGVFFIIAGIAG
ncbi:hypothetical protein [Paludifilum halophilum]|uniref:Uncharacterized protein n=1 Tax=Paludifilum halophilum TaxID=1642702 RepID=A0A235BAG5_9BACL|nr:hypothetical protein [Paludifilum halophilum]OYD08575.1 hypothetical protein CHM34_07055 [Paludifilum halophilum]